MIDYKALAGRLDRFADWVEMNGFDVSDIRAAAQLARERAEAPEPVGWMRPDDLQQAAVAPRLCRMHPEKDKQSDMVPVYLHPPAAQPQSEPTYLDPTAVALGLAWSEDGQADSVEPTEYIYIRLKRPEGYEDVRGVAGVDVKPARGLVAWFLRRQGLGGITLPTGIYLLPERLHDAELIAHERMHQQQIARMGMVRFYATYLWQLVRYGYKDHPLER